MKIFNKCLILGYKTTWIVWFVVRCSVSSFLFRLKLICSNVTFDTVKVCGSCPQVRISKDAKEVVIGKGVAFNNYNDAGWFAKSSIWVRPGASLKIGNNSGFNGALLYAANSVQIGSHVNIGGGTRIMDTDFHPLDYRLRRQGLEGTNSAPIVIEDDVFIGTNCIILKGVTIGARSIVAAGSVVTKSIPKDEIWGGNPAHFIRSLKS